MLHFGWSLISSPHWAISCCSIVWLVSFYYWLVTCWVLCVNSCLSRLFFLSRFVPRLFFDYWSDSFWTLKMSMFKCSDGLSSPARDSCGGCLVLFEVCPIRVPLFHLQEKDSLHLFPLQGVWYLRNFLNSSFGLFQLTPSRSVHFSRHLSILEPCPEFFWHFCFTPFIMFFCDAFPLQAPSLLGCPTLGNQLGAIQIVCPASKWSSKATGLSACTSCQQFSCRLFPWRLL